MMLGLAAAGVLLFLIGWARDIIVDWIEKRFGVEYEYDSSGGRRWVKKPPEPRYKYSRLAGGMVKNKKWRPPDNEED